jgi:hypothetical protein
MTQQFERELADSIQRMREAVSPYTRFVRVEREKLEQTAGSMEQARQELAQLRAGVNSAVGTRNDVAGDVPVSAVQGS